MDKDARRPAPTKGGASKKGLKGTSPRLEPEPEPPEDPNAPTAEQVCGCPNTIINAYSQNLMKLHLEDEPPPVARRKTLGPMAMAAIELKRAKRNPQRLVRFCNCHESVAECHNMLVEHKDDHRLSVRTYCGGCNEFTSIPRLPIQHASTDYCSLPKPKRASQKFGGKKKRYFMYGHTYAVAPLEPLGRRFWHW